MPGFPAPFIRFREDDANGKPLAGGKLYSYIVGTSTPQPTYTTAALDVPNSNPTILDASGRAAVFIEDGVGYKFVLRDALDNVIWTEDKIQVPQIEAPAPPVVVPPGAMVAFGGSAAPSGWLLCNGQSVSTTTYAGLFTVLLYTYGGSGGTFNVPDLRQRFPMGKAAAGVGVVLGAAGGAIDHTHTVPRAGWGATTVPAVTFAGYLISTVGGGGNVDLANGDNTSGGSNPPYLVVNYIIKT